MPLRSILSRGGDRASASRTRAARPRLEGLEERFLLYATTGDAWPYPVRVTYSFMPDGTYVGGNPPSSLFATMNKYYPTATWEQTLQTAAASWEDAANVNLVLVSDNGAPYASSGNEQGDTHFGDIRIGAIPMAAGTAAMAILPPPGSTGTDAGDIFFNSNVNWGTSGTNQVDLLTLAEHELGHALGMAHSANTTAVMYAVYTGPNQTLTADDIAGIQSIYGPTASVGGGATSSTATDITPYLSNNQIALGGQSLSDAWDVHYYKVTVPSTTTGSMTVTEQTANLSSLEPYVAVFGINPVYGNWAGLGYGVSTSYGGTASYTVNNVKPGQTYLIRVTSDVSGPGSAGAYGLEVNFGSGTQAPIAPPYTTVASPPVYGGTVAYDTTPYDLHAKHRHAPVHSQAHRVHDAALANWTGLPRR